MNTVYSAERFALCLVDTAHTVVVLRVLVLFIQKSWRFMFLNEIRKLKVSAKRQLMLQRRNAVVK